MSPIKAIRAYCIGCQGNMLKEVRLCPSVNCELYPFRMGKNPNRCKTEAEKEADTEEAEEFEEAFDDSDGETNIDYD